jgi:hypothetical protein
MSATMLKKGIVKIFLSPFTCLLSCRSYTWTCITAKAFAAPGGVWSIGAVPKLVCTPEVFTLTCLHTGPELHMDMYKLYHFRGICIS